ncbi:ABC-F family ATP-binding cassette domain-containing protein [Hespellia stercorisuis]|uniref:ATP-binding cassette, subfamily F, uup n=1 Tax=Hespellia stercorisuis DSM 15480 TaxID=1121950 RepID=A0A1M6HRV7_9FIRM|nr:ABC-F family ATP-binding cassette domain-containing protein [Hespellia stercorisuis]SHJ24844.1 ATP-binding cassette, subfamily F, uup [Hespellia stercorisuis DSM 15480]
MNLLTMEQITKAYTDKILLDRVDFSINEHEKIGVIGINGTGKSTLLKIAAGLEEEDDGKISKGSNVKLRYLQQTPVFEKDMTILDAVLHDNVSEINEWSIESEAKIMIQRLELPDYSEKVEHLSGGQKKRVALANTLLAPVEILVLDEPTNHLDEQTSSWLEEYLTAFKGAILMVTHDRYFLDRVATRIVEVDKAKIYNYPGNYSEYVTLKAERQNIEIAGEKKRQNILRTELEWLHRGARARSTKQKAHIDRIEALQNTAAPVQDGTVTMNSVSSRMGKKTIELEHISKAYGDKRLIQDYSYIFLKNDRIGIIGENGCGKSTLLKIITGELAPDEGTVETGETIRVGYFSQENEALDDSMRVIDYVKEVGEYIRTTDGLITASQMLEKFLFEGSAQWSPIGKLSGGEKRRLYLLRILMSSPNVLILDEPTNDLDIQTLTILEDYLDSFDGIVITVSHDRYFLDRIVRRIFSFEGAGEVKQYEGNYSDYLLARPEEPGTGTSGAASGSSGAAAGGKSGGCTDSKAVNADSSDAQLTDQKSADTGRGHARKLKFSYKEQREFEGIDEEIATLEEKIEQLDADAAKNASVYGKLNEIMEEKAEAEQQLEEKMERWVYLNDLHDQIMAEKSEG